MQAHGRVVASPDPNDEDSAFTGGAEEDEPGTWDRTTEHGGVDPPKDNIRDACSARAEAHRQTFLYLGFTREQGKAPRTWPSSSTRTRGSGTTAAPASPAGGPATSC